MITALSHIDTNINLIKKMTCEVDFKNSTVVNQGVLDQIRSGIVRLKGDLDGFNKELEESIKLKTEKVTDKLVDLKLIRKSLNGFMTFVNSTKMKRFLYNELNALNLSFRLYKELIRDIESVFIHSKKEDKTSSLMSMI